MSWDDWLFVGWRDVRGKVWYGDERADVEELEDWIGCDESIFSFPQFLGYDGTLPTSYYDGSDLAMMLAPPMAYGWPTGKKLVFAQDRKMVDDKELAWGWREGRLLSSFFFLLRFRVSFSFVTLAL